MNLNLMIRESRSTIDWRTIGMCMFGKTFGNKQNTVARDLTRPLRVCETELEGMQAPGIDWPALERPR